MIGIYKIINNITKDFYIGSSNNIKSRWRLHKHDLRKNKHHSIILQRSWNKYKENNFEFIVIEECTKENLISIEQKYLDLNPVYNINKIAQNCTGRVCLETTRLKISNANTGNRHSKETKKLMSKYRQENPLIFTKEIKDKISKSKLGNKNPMYGKPVNPVRILAVQKALTGIPRTKEVKDKISKSNSISIVQLSLTNDFIKEWKSSMEIERTLEGFLGNGVTRVCKKSRKTYKNFKWQYKTEYETNNKTNNC